MRCCHPVNQQGKVMFRSTVGALALGAALTMTIAPVIAFDESKYPEFNGQWRRAPGAGIGWDETKPRGLEQKPPLTPEYQAIWEASMADEAAGGQGLDTRVTCISNGMPRMATIANTLGRVSLTIAHSKNPARCRFPFFAASACRTS